jgi:hypothetical protein
MKRVSFSLSLSLSLSLLVQNKFCRLRDIGDKRVLEEDLLL